MRISKTEAQIGLKYLVPLCNRLDGDKLGT